MLLRPENTYTSMATAHKERDEVKQWRNFLCCYTVVSSLSHFSLGRCRAAGKLTTFSYIRLKQKSSSSHPRQAETESYHLLF